MKVERGREGGHENEDVTGCHRVINMGQSFLRVPRILYTKIKPLSMSSRIDIIMHVQIINIHVTMQNSKSRMQIARFEM